MTIKKWACKHCLIATMFAFSLTSVAQQSTGIDAASKGTISSASAVPQLMNYAGVLTNVNGKPLAGVIGVTFLLYKDQQGGSPLWMETQNVQPDKSGHYSVILGSTTSGGMPRDVFVSGEARWLGVQVAGEQEQPRVVLAAVPYSLKAADAETIGGLPASAFVLANGSATSVSAGASSGTTPGNATPAHPSVTGKGVVNFIPMWDKTTDIVNSLIFQKNSQIGINTKAPAATLDLNGKGDIRDTLTLFPKGTDSTLAISGTPFNIDNTGSVTFISGQTFPGTGTITGVNTASGSGLSGGGTSGTLNLSVDPAFVPELASANTFTNANMVNANTGGAALTLQNASGDGLDIYPGTGSDGVYIPRNAGQYGIVAYGGSAEGGYFNGPVAGSYSVNTTDGNGSAAAYGQEFGSTQITYGVVGYSASNLGIRTYGQSVSASVDGSFFAGGGPLGVWGDSGAPGATGVLASVDYGNAIIAINNSDGLYTAFFENEEDSRNDDAILDAHGGVFGGDCLIDVSGNLFCSGSKSAVVPVDGGARKVALYAVESPENWFEDFGSGQLSNGVVTIFLEPTFQQTVNPGADYHVFLTSNGDSRGLYVTQKTATSFEVREQGGGTSSIAFDYRIVGRRKGYEQIRLADKTQLMNTPRPKRAKGPRSVMPTDLGIGKAHEPTLRAARPAQLVVNKK
jgi:hypothetical protein